MRSDNKPCLVHDVIVAGIDRVRASTTVVHILDFRVVSMIFIEE